MSSDPESQGSSTRPYLIRALHDWCTDNGFTPYLAVYVDKTVQVPQEYVKNNEIVLNVSFEATSQLRLGNDFIEFKARFGGLARDILVPIDHVIAVYARENGQGMAFPVPTPAGEGDAPTGGASEVVSTAAPVQGLHLASPPSTAPKPGKERGSIKVLESTTRGDDETPEPTPPSGGGGRPALRRIK